MFQMKGTSGVDTNLARGGDAFPQTEVADDVDDEETQSHVPLDGTEVVDPLAPV